MVRLDTLRGRALSARETTASPSPSHHLKGHHQWRAPSEPKGKGGTSRPPPPNPTHLSANTERTTAFVQSAERGSLTQRASGSGEGGSVREGGGREGGDRGAPGGAFAPPPERGVG
ncbi:hypothetical protein Sjap_017372 [Stephania japonica]|uniref:Uncharacterized protein n=1 Tax=Stephania japonica TaxID=461633 RepID=A0AAP0NI77_9MAGN